MQEIRTKKPAWRQVGETHCVVLRDSCGLPISTSLFFDRRSAFDIKKRSKTSLYKVRSTMYQVDSDARSERQETRLLVLRDSCGLPISTSLFFDRRSIFNIKKISRTSYLVLRTLYLVLSTKKALRSESKGFNNVAATYSPGSNPSTIGAAGLNFSVRDGKRWDPCARPPKL